MKVGLVGSGRVAGVHMAVYRKIKDVNVVAVSDVNLEKAKTFADIHGIAKVFSDYKDLLGIKELDYVDICTPTSTHAKIVCDAAESGHNILVEKPMAKNTSECEKMIRESEKHRVKFCVCHNQLFHPAVMKAKSLVDSGSFDLLSFKTLHKESFDLLKAVGLAQVWNVTPEEKGILWEVGTHLAYLQLHFLQNVQEVYALGTKTKYPVHTEFTVLLRTSDQRYGIIETSWLSKESETVYEISSSDGRRGQVLFDYDLFIEKSETPPMNVTGAVHNAYVDVKRGLQKWTKFGVNYVRKRKLLPHFNLINRYMDSLKKDSDVPVRPEDGKKTIKLLEGIEESLNKNCAVKIT